MNLITGDFHLHTTFSTDGKATMEEMIQRGIALGLNTMCFTEHMDYDNNYDEGPDAFIVDTDSYYIKYQLFREKYGAQIELLFGVELGLQEHLVARYHNYVNQYPFDFIIGSSHLAGGIDPYLPEFFKDRTEEEAYRFYFETIAKNVRLFDDFDVYGHLDYALRYGPTMNRSFTYEKYGDILDAILKTLIEKGKGIELNTAGYKYGMNMPHPHISILKRYRELGGELITVGSDAHQTEHLAYEFKKAADVLVSCGFSYYTQFRERQPHFLPLV